MAERGRQRVSWAGMMGPVDAWRDVPKVVVGMVHLRPLPGAPAYGGSLAQVIDAAVRDAEALAEGGVHGLMLENFGDAPFFPGRVPAITVAAMTAAACEVRRRVPTLPLGINVLRNDGRSALAVAVACGASFIRVNVLTSVRVADQGLLHGMAHDLMRERANLGASDVKVLADVDVKHSAALAERELADEVDDLIERGGADGLIVSGAGTGKATPTAKLAAVCAAARGRRPVFVGSGATADTAAELLKHADALIVGTAFKEGGVATGPVVVERVRAMMKVVGS